MFRYFLIFSDESFRDYHPLPPPAKQPYIDPWDLENYAYIREHLDSMELSSNPSLPQSGSSAGSGEDFGEANSNSFFYVPGTKRLSDRHNDINGDYADIDEVKYVSRRPINRRSSHYDYGKIIKLLSFKICSYSFDDILKLMISKLPYKYRLEHFCGSCS